MNAAALEQVYNTVDHHPQFKRARWVTLEEGQLLDTIAQEEKPDHIFESGTANGFSTMWLSLFGCPVTTFDPVSRGKVWDVMDGLPDNIIYVEESFEAEVGEYAKKVTGRKMFFIDGLHTSHGIKDDLAAIKEVVQDGDILVFHDLSEKPPLRFWQRTIGSNSSESEVYNTRRIMGRMIWAD